MRSQRRPIVRDVKYAKAPPPGNTQGERREWLGGVLNFYHRHAA
jgi:hypothetical protein